MSDIKIVVACHKPSELPHSDLYYPVQVGAAIAKRKLDLPGDNTGDNISEKNETYCELTAQYWAWKNLKADYYGLCHYRRFLYLQDQVLPDEDERRQVEVNVLNDYSQKKYAISDFEGSRKFVEKYDVVVGMEQKVENLYTPAGHQKTAMAHWLVHNRYLINADDLKLMLAILKKKYPEIAESTMRYLKGPHFLGFNCFVMKKKYFDEMSSMEFDVLQTLEKHVDRSRYHQQLNRIYGFMGEILFSGYVAYLREKKLAKIKNVQLIYFNETDPVNQYYPDPIEEENTVPVAYYQGGNITGAMFTVSLKSLIDHISDDKVYDLNVIYHDTFNKFYQNKIIKIAENHTNLHIRFLKAAYYQAEQQDLGIRNNSIGLDIPWIFKNYKQIVFLCDGMLPQRDVADLYAESLSKEQVIAAPKDLLNIAKVNGGAISFYDHLKNKIGISDPYEYFSTDICKMDVEALRALFEEKDLLEKIDIVSKRTLQQIYHNDIYNLCLARNQIKEVSFSWQFIPNTSDYTRYFLPQMPYLLYKEYQQMNLDTAYGIKLYPQELAGRAGMENSTAELLFEIAKTVGVYEIMVHEIAAGTFVPRVSNKLDSLFPANSWQTSLAYKVFPIGTPRYERMRNILVKNKLIR